MSPMEVVLLQKESSPHRPSLEQALSQEGMGKHWRAEGAPLPAVSLGPEDLVVWDLSGYAAAEIEALALVLVAGRAGVVVACAVVDELARQALLACQALGLVVLPVPPLAIAAALEVARSTRRRLFALDQEREDLLRQLAERETIERAKRVLMAASGVGEEEAMRQMQRHARDTNQKLVAVARKLLEVYKIFNGHG